MVRRVRRSTRRPRRQTGRGVMDVLKKLHAFAKSRKLISGALSHFGHNKLAAAARAVGYGRRRRRVVRRRRAPVRRRRMAGRGFFEDFGRGFMMPFKAINSIIPGGISTAAGMVHPLAGVAARAVGLGRRRRARRQGGRGAGIRF